MKLKNALRTIVFSEEAFDEDSKTVSRAAGWFGFFITVFIFAIPDTIESFRYLPQNYFTSMVGYGIAILLCYLLISLFKKRLVKPILMHPVNTYFALSLLIISVPVFLIAYWFFQVYLENALIASLLFTLIPYYNFILFGWLMENASDEKGWKGVFIGIFSITVLFLFQYFLAYFVV